MGSEGVGTVIDKNVVMDIVKNEDWRVVAKYLRELKEDLREGFDKLSECLTCPANSLLCSEVARLVESYERALVATIMLRCLLNDALRVVEDERIRKRLIGVLEVTNDLAAFLNEKHGLVHQLMKKCEQFWGDSI
jgi:hypothetical protein